MQQTIRERMEGSQHFPGHLGVKIGALARGYAELKLALRPEFLQYQEVAHGGVLAALADTAVAVALMSQVGLAMNFTTVDLHMFYFAPARGATVSARARIVKPGRRINVGEVDIEDETGKLVAKSVVTYILLEARP
jgi:acyl-CoA thioesterase